MTSRQRVLEYLRAYPVVSTVDLARALQMTQSNARHHLSQLRQDGLIEVTGVRRAGLAGRPAKLVRLRPFVLGENSDNLVDCLLGGLLAGTPEEQNARLRELARRLLPAAAAVHDLPAVQRINSLVDGLNTLHYRARWEAHARGAHVILENCPYHNLVDKHPELCQVDGFIMEEWLALTVHRIVRRDAVEHSAPPCVFSTG